MTEFHPRSDWSVVDVTFTPLATPVEDVVIHHSGADGPDHYDPDYLRAVEAYEMQRADALDAIAYHRIVFANGDCAEGRYPDVRGAATYAWNDKSIALMAVGNFENYDPSQECVDRLVFEIQWMQQHGFIVANPRIRSHSDMPNNSTACCGAGLKARISEIVQRCTGVAPSPEPGPEPAPAPQPQPDYVPAWPGVLLENPHTGDGTAQWQQQMSNRGWTIAVDNEYGDESEKVCRQFQEEKNLVVDGIVGPITWDAAWSLPVT